MNPSADPDEGPAVVVAIATYRRPHLLAGLIPLVVAEAATLRPPARVIVVDNDPDESARDVLAACGQRDVTYLAEPRPGIAAARNAAVDASAGCDALVFLDDDEVPEPGWLGALVDAWSQWRCTAVAGPVVSRFNGAVEPWVAACSTFRRPRRASGTTLRGAATNNLLLDRHELDRLGLRFDDRFGLSGGSDTLLTHTVVRRGGEIRWCDEAVMHETVPAARANRRWVLRRTERTGNVWSRVKLALAETATERARTRMDLTLRAAYRIASGVLRAAVGGVTRDLARRSAGEMDVVQGIGMLRGAYGHVVTEYLRQP